MFVATPCPERQMLERLAGGESIGSRLEAHVASCEPCTKLLATIRADNDLIAELLGAHGDVGGMMRASIAPGNENAPIPGYRLVRELHRGGQGVVWLAEQLTARDRTVAIKTLVQGRFATTRQRRRFEREVEVVASLRHPGIVTLFESGRARTGEVFFAMEFVEGRTLDRWIEHERPPRRRRIALFLAVLDAVRYAHGRGVIHRDLKPANILVDADDRPHILDFGLARTDDEQDREHATKAGEFLGTFAYAAPEQIAGEPDRIEVRTDVYALGVILYEMLAGRRPFDESGSLVSLVQARMDERRLPPSRHAPDVDRDLDAICLTALATDPERRYASVDAFADDLRRWVEGRPVMARGEGTLYVVGKSIRRHKVPFAAVTAIIVLSVGSAIGFARLYTRAESEARIARETLRGFQESIREINPETGSADSNLLFTDYLELVDRRIEETLGDQPEVAAAMLTTVGLNHMSFENLERARIDLERAYALREALRNDGRGSSADLAESLHNLGRITVAEGDPRGALAYYERALELRERLGPEHERDLAMTLQHMGSCMRRTGDLASAEAYYARSRALWERVDGGVSENVAAILNGRAFIERARGDHDAALELFVAAREMMGRVDIASTDYRIGRVTAEIGRERIALGDVVAGLHELETAHEILDARYGGTATHVIALALDIARARLDAGDRAGLRPTLASVLASIDDAPEERSEELAPLRARVIELLRRLDDAG